MFRQKGLSRAYTSVSATAVLGLLVGCSQPASYATVDLGGSYGNGVPQTLTAPSGLPVYQSTQVYTTPAAPQQISQSQLVYLDAPANQVASLSPGLGGYSPALPQSYPVFDQVVQGPVMTDETVLRSDGYIDVGDYVGVQTAALAPGLGSIGLDQMPAPLTQSYQSVPYSVPAPIPAPMPEALPLPAPQVDTDYTALPQLSYQPQPSYEAAPIYAPIAEPLLPAAPQVQQQTYAELPGQPDRGNLQEVVDYYDLANPAPRVEAQDVAFTAPTAALPPAPAAPTPAPVYTAPSGIGGIALPPASQAYPRPYEALRPGFFPNYDFPSGSGLISEAPVETAPVQVAELAPQTRIDNVFTADSGIVTTPAPVMQQASSVTLSGQSYTIQPGDTLYAIARMHGVTPMQIAQANDLPMAGTIYAGNALTIPSGGIAGRPETLGDAPVVVLQTTQAMPVERFAADAASINTYTADMTRQSVEMIDLEELARMFNDRRTGQPGAAMPVISAEAGARLRGRTDLTPTEVISTPAPAVQSIIPMEELAAVAPIGAKAPHHAWPVHGSVYRLEGGAIEIDAAPGMTVAATSSGNVVHVQDGPRGVLVVIEHDDGWRSLTLGLSEAVVQVGQRVFSGATLGSTDTRRITFELRDGSSNVAEVLDVLRG